ncbi:hypothetical protein L228DRAFT_244794 [Xylona heveae TC161]|uniref:Rhodopsin domain-containing protein n=1 Tax=Xylona heveae (strain CBS 132557 / TC161) TaxID=1328760 RepID=A0A165HU93_XYLHT|nr:hypothetical protein L228DRAFT_244794 [Xylona heveae TC161]KZF23932.1 hypothetical protein L228DRAFT_244794 [Xylona heveae TC161]
MVSAPTPAQLLKESIIFYSIAVIIFGGRIWSRIISTGSIKRLKIDDYVMIVTFCFYTALLVLLQIAARYATNLIDPADIPKVLANPKDVADRIFGSKIDIGVEQCMLVTLWGVKASILALYHKLTIGLRQNLFVKILAGYVAFGFVFIEITFFFVYCRPFSDYWAVPPRDYQCANYFKYCVTQTVFNISSDALMLAIPIPLIVKTQLPPLKKGILLAVFSLGIFVIVAAILNKYYNFSFPTIPVYMVWHIRESSTSIYVSNLMCWWPLLRMLFGLRSFSGRHTSASGSKMEASHLASFDGNRRRAGVLNPFKRGQRCRSLTSISGITSVSQEAIYNPSHNYNDENRDDPRIKPRRGSDDAKAIGFDIERGGKSHVEHGSPTKDKGSVTTNPLP